MLLAIISKQGMDWLTNTWGICPKDQLVLIYTCATSRTQVGLTVNVYLKLFSRKLLKPCLFFVVCCPFTRHALQGQWHVRWNPYLCHWICVSQLEDLPCNFVLVINVKLNFPLLSVWVSRTLERVNLPDTDRKKNSSSFNPYLHNPKTRWALSSSEEALFNLELAAMGSTNCNCLQIWRV